MDGQRWQRNEWGRKTEVQKGTVQSVRKKQTGNTREYRNEYRLRQRKVIEGIESLRVRHNKKNVLINKTVLNH